MTVAICYVSPEGVVFGADSTASLMVQDGGFHYLNHNQKIFEIGSDSQLGIMTWGLCALGTLSHRTQIAQLSDAFAKSPPTSVEDACHRWIDHFWVNYQAIAAPDLTIFKALHAKNPHDPSDPTKSGTRTKDEEKGYAQLKLGLVVGFCIGGYHPSDRIPYAYEIVFDPLNGKPTPKPVLTGDTRCWGAPKVFSRIVSGIDPEIHQTILSSGKWTGTATELQALLASHQMYLPGLPVRDAIDFVYSCVSSTIKALKFSHLSQVCGGPIEVAVITTDRNFRWVRHKEWDVAINEGFAQNG